MKTDKSNSRKWIKLTSHCISGVTLEKAKMPHSTAISEDNFFHLTNIGKLFSVHEESQNFSTVSNLSGKATVGNG